MTVTNPYYEFDPNFVPFTKARAGDNNNQFQAIQNAFDLLPGAADALTTDTATFAPESGTGNAYVVTMPDTRTVNQDGDGIRFFATHTNTGACTLDVDSIGPVAFVNWDGDVFTGTEIVDGQFYEVRYDAVQALFILAATTDNVLQVQFAEEWAIKAEDVPVSVAAGGNGVNEFSSFHWAQKSLASAITGRVNTDIVTATPPTTEAVTGAFEIYDAVAEDDDLLLRLGFQASNTVVLRNLMHGGAIFLQVENSGGSLRTPIVIGGSGSVDLAHGIDTVFQTGTNFNFSRTGFNAGLQQIITIGDQSLFTDLLTAYTFEAATSGDPGGEEFGFDSATLTSITEMRIDDAALAQFINADQFAGAITPHDHILTKRDNLLEYNRFEVTGVPVDNTGYWTIPLRFVGGDAGAFGAGQDYSIFLLAAAIEKTSLRADIVTATDPTTEAVTALDEIYDLDGTDLLAKVGFDGSNKYTVRNKMQGGGYLVTVEGSGGTAGDADFAQVAMLADGDGADGATTYTEVSLNAASATFVGNAELDTAQFKFGTASFLMDGTGDYVTFPDDASLELGSDTFTIEGWVRFNTLPLDNEEMSLVSQWEGVGSDRAFNLFIQKHPVFDFSLGFEWEDDTGGIESGSIDPIDPVTDQWFHFAVTKDANDALFMWWDGAREFNSGTGLFDGAIQNSTSTIKLGVRDPADAGNEQFLDGWLDDVRITVGAATDRYDTSGDLTVPTEAFPTSVAGTNDENFLLETVSGDALFDDVVLLLSLDGTDGQTTTVDESLLANSVSFEGAVDLTTDEQKFGTTSLDTTTGDPLDYLEIPHDSAFVTGSGDWTLEFFVNTNNQVGGHDYINHGDGGTGLANWQVLNANGSLQFPYSDNGGSSFNNFPFFGTMAGNGVWQHVAITRLGNDLFAHIDGVKSGATVDVTGDTIGGTGVTPINIGSRNSSVGPNIADADAYIDEVRFTVGTARYTTANFTPPAAAFDSAGSVGGLALGDGSGNESARTVAPADGGLEANNLDTGAGSERVLTTSDIGSAASGSFNVLTDIVTATPPTTEAVSGDYQISDLDETDTLMRLGYFGSNVLEFNNLMHGGAVLISAQNNAGAKTSLVEGDPDGTTILYAAGIHRFNVQSTGRMALRSDTNTDLEERKLLFCHQDASDRAWVGHDGDEVLTLKNEIHGAPVRLIGEDLSGTVQILFNGDPDGASVLYNAGTIRLRAASTGKIQVRSDTNTDTEERRVMFEHQDGTDRGYLGYASSDIFRMKNEIHGGDLILEAEDLAGTVRVLSRLRPDSNISFNCPEDFQVFVNNTETAIIATQNAGVDLYHNGLNVVRTLVAASGGLQANNTLTGGGLERVLTTSDISGGGAGRADGAKVFNSSAQSISTSVETAVIFGGEAYDDDAYHAGGSPTRLTIPAGGARQIRLTGQITWPPNGSAFRRIEIRRNGINNGRIDDDVVTFYTQIYASAANATVPNLGMQFDTGIIATDTADYFEVFVFQTSGLSLSLVDEQNWFQIEDFG